MDHVLLEKIVDVSGSAFDVMWQLFKNGPTWDGDIASKSGRSDLITAGLANRVQGWSYLTDKGMELAVRTHLFGDRKEQWDRRRRQFRGL